MKLEKKGDFSRILEGIINQMPENINHKEQDFQGRIYAGLLPLEKDGYIVEMETSRNDAHVKDWFDDSCNWEKTEMDILVYHPESGRRFAAELKWHYDPGFHYFDRLDSFEKDARFVRQLEEHANFTEACSVVVIDTTGITNPRQDRKNQDAIDLFQKGIMDGRTFQLKELHSKNLMYYILN